MSLPKTVIQIAITGTQILGKAFLAAGQQAVKNAKYKPQGVGGGEAAGVSNAMTGSSTDKLTREHRMTLDEAHLILNLKRESPLEEVMKHYEHLYKANSPPAPPAAGEAKAAAPTRSGRGRVQPAYSHYLQSKVVRALERIKAEEAGETAVAEEAGTATAEAGASGTDAASAASKTPGSSTGAPPP